MNPFKDEFIYTYVVYLKYIRLHVFIQTKFNAVQYVRADDMHNIYDYILARQNK